jgi:PIN domain nuclease of toxin-antitoxin system
MSRWYFIWELVLLVEKKRLDLDADMGEWVQQSMRDLDLQEAPFTSAVAHELRCRSASAASPRTSNSS